MHLTRKANCNLINIAASTKLGTPCIISIPSSREFFFPLFIIITCGYKINFIALLILEKYHFPKKFNSSLAAWDLGIQPSCRGCTFLKIQALVSVISNIFGKILTYSLIRSCQHRKFILSYQTRIRTQK